ncbi:MAG: hypothetical protein PHW18_03930 [Sulfuricurvum sp.]|uniref:hypothetical protein n=1 Tax=Sulfuricurvum sp. TaxID=2025608 RepID=UPI002627876B|nr:hypothetical protein [Sulfuricurvum sp.]MDD2828702.1 hypothetical protein [Sulfuricurvum sp.]MDD4949280.1 hypothetical protein [Sulfuricurvum sp.]
MQSLDLLDEALEHIKSVESETIELTRIAELSIVRYIEKNGLTLDDETLEAMQYQDIVSQQLHATIEMIENIQNLIRTLRENEGSGLECLSAIEEELSSVLQQAREKHSAFSGKFEHHDDGVEFF